MKERTNLEAFGDIALSIIPIAGYVYAGRKNHKEGFVEANKIHEKKYQELNDRNRQFRKDVLGDEHTFICPQSWDADFWSEKMNVFVKEQIEGEVSARELLANFLKFCIDTFPQRRLAQTLEDLKTIRRVVTADREELLKIDQEDVGLAIDFLGFYREDPEIKEIKDGLLSVLPSTNGCNFLVLGRTGVGKSSLLNSLLGVESFKTGTGRPVTRPGIFESESELDGIKVRVYDSWGIEADKLEQWYGILKDAQEKHDVSHKVEDWFHAVIYCVGAGGSRVEDVDIGIIRSLLQDDLYVVVALTKADQCSEADANKLRQALVSQCEKLEPENVIETCVGAETRQGKVEPFGIDELKRAVLRNYRRTIEAQLPSRCIHLAMCEVNAFKEENEKWISSRKWKYDENENNKPLRMHCNNFLIDLRNNRIPAIVRNEILACSKYGRNLFTALHFDDVNVLMPDVPPEMNWLESVGNWFSKTLDFLTPWGPTDNDNERERLRGMLNEFCRSACDEIEKQRDVIARKVIEVMK